MARFDNNCLVSSFSPFPILQNVWSLNHVGLLRGWPPCRPYFIPVHRRRRRPFFTILPLFYRVQPTSSRRRRHRYYCGGGSLNGIKRRRRLKSPPTATIIARFELRRPLDRPSHPSRPPARARRLL